MNFLGNLRGKEIGDVVIFVNGKVIGFRKEFNEIVIYMVFYGVVVGIDNFDKIWEFNFKKEWLLRI